MTSTVDVKDDARNRPIQKAKVCVLQMKTVVFRMYSHDCFFLTHITCTVQIEILIGKTEKFDELMAAAAEERAAAGAAEEEQS
jgi:hypothetical protein